LPGDQEVALTLSYSGNPEIYRLNLKSKKLTPITNSSAIDVDPSMAARPDLMAFLSGRGGKANVYLADPRGLEKNVRRISYVGRFNATPRLAPDGQEIAFVSWADETFDIFRINSDGRGLVRLTKDFGSCEDPSYSPDGQFIVFQAKRLVPGATHPYNLYVMDREGDILGAVVQNLGNCTTPRWSK
jgi:TolB protein